MHRVLLGMALTNYLLLAVTVSLGLAIRQFGDAAFGYHFPLAMLTALFSLLAHCLVFTYFLGTTRWVKETSAAYSLPMDFVRRSSRCRSRAFALALISMLLTIASIASGAGADTKVWPVWVHQFLPAFTYTFMLLAYRVEYQSIETHIDLTNEIMAEVDRLRSQRSAAGAAAT